MQTDFITKLNSRTYELATKAHAHGLRPKTAGLLARFLASYEAITDATAERLGHRDFSPSQVEFMLRSAMKIAMDKTL